MRRAAVLFLFVALGTACASSTGAGAPQPSALQTTSGPSPSETPPPADTALLRFAVIGDFGSGSEEQYRLAERMCIWRRGDPFDLVITTGDNIYNAGEPVNFEPNFFRPYECLFDAGVRWRAVLGNHDIGTDNGRPELDEPAFGIKRRNYVVRKSGVRFVMWESNYSDRDWLRANLGEEPGDRWTVVAFHHPVFTPGPHGDTPGYRPSLPRLFARKGVDLVLNGHDHLYARMSPKRGVRFVVTGGGGAGLYDCLRPSTTERCIEKHHFLYVVVRAEKVIVRAVPISGGPIDRFTTIGRK